MLDKLRNFKIGGNEFLPIFEGGKGIGLSNGITAGNFAKCGAVGTISGVNTDVVDGNGKIVPFVLKARNRLERHLEMIENSIKGIISQAKLARDISGGNGRININVLWEMGGTEFILNEALSKVKGLIQGIVCGAGMPYKLGKIAAKHEVNYFPIVSSMRAFRILWLRSFQKTKDWLGGIVYECPWKAGGHNGLTNAEDPFVPQDPYFRIKELRTFMNEVGLNDLPIIFAGGVWNIKEYENYLDNPEIGNVAFQFGTRPLVTEESPAPQGLKEKLLTLKQGDVITNDFSPTGFYSSAIRTPLIEKLLERKKRQLECSVEENDIYDTEIIDFKTKAKFFIKKNDIEDVMKWQNDGFTRIKTTPDKTIVFISDNDDKDINEDLKNCCGCLSQCRFSGWSQYVPESGYTTGKTLDCRSFCIQHALQAAKNGNDYERELCFAGSIATRFATDEMYKNHHIPTIKELISAIIEGR